MVRLVREQHDVMGSRRIDPVIPEFPAYVDRGLLTLFAGHHRLEGWIFFNDGFCT
jgi:hypothetical protein